MANTGIFRGEGAHLGAPKAPLLIQEGRRISAGGGYQPIRAASAGVVTRHRPRALLTL